MFDIKANRIYIKKVELGSLINKNTVKEEIDPDIELDRMNNKSGDENLHRELKVNNAGKIECMLSKMEQWSILSNIINYIQYSKNPKNFHAMMIKPINKDKTNIGRRKRDRDEFALQVGLIDTSDRVTKEYLDSMKELNQKY